MNGLNETVASAQAVDISSPSGLVPEGLTSFLADVYSNGLLGLGLFLLLLALGLALHGLNMKRTYERVAATTNGGEVYSSHDGGVSWTPHGPPPGGTQIYALARG